MASHMAYSAPASLLVTLLSRALMSPQAAIAAATTMPQLGMVSGSLSNCEARAGPTAARNVPIPASVVLMLFIGSVGFRLVCKNVRHDPVGDGRLLLGEAHVRDAYCSLRAARVI